MKTNPVSRQPLRLAIVGGGPNATYAVERLAAHALRAPDTLAIDLHIFDQHGSFGDGAVHDAGQPETSLLLRVIGEVSMAIDDAGVGDDGPIVDRTYRPTLYEFARQKFAETRDPAFDVRPEDHPTRRLHGLALRDSFNQFLTLLKANARVDVRLHHDEVVDIAEGSDGTLLLHSKSGTKPIAFDRILLATGAGIVDPTTSRSGREFVEFALAHSVTYISSAYPLQTAITKDRVTPDDVVGCRGMGVTAADIILFLTEGRGGVFEGNASGKLVYRRSGREPRKIVPFGRSGLFNYSKPVKQPGGSKAPKPVFWTQATVDRVRTLHGVPMLMRDGTTRRQIDFDRSLTPILVLEMALIYYRTLLGEDFAARLVKEAEPHLESFIASGQAAHEPVNPETLLHAIDPLLHEAAGIVDGVLDRSTTVADAAAKATSRGWRLEPALARYREAVFGSTDDDMPKARMERRLADNLFGWFKLTRPIGEADQATPESFARAALDLMDRDNLWAAQGNRDNPAKAAMDGVWRGMRSVYTYAVNDGGLTAESHRRYLETHKAHRARLAIGAPPSSMRKIQALVECGLVDLSIGPGGHAVTDAESGRFRVRGARTGADVPVTVLIEGLVPSFDAARMLAPLYPNLLKRGLVRRWRNPSADGNDFEPGGLDFNESFQPYRRDGTVERRLGVLGAPTEGKRFQQTGLARPGVDHHNLRDVKAWTDAALESTFGGGAEAETGTSVESGDIVARTAEQRP